MKIFIISRYSKKLIICSTMNENICLNNNLLLTNRKPTKVILFYLFTIK